jgi:predicted phosphodiesterase
MKRIIFLSGIIFLLAFGINFQLHAVTVVTYKQVTVIESGKSYVLAMSGIKPNEYTANLQVAMKTTSPSGASVNFDFKDFKAGINESGEGLLWQIEEFQDQYSVKAIGLEGENVYMNIAAGTLTLGTQQALTISPSANTFKITNNIGGTNYYARFTNSFTIEGVNISCFTAGTKIESTDFILYEVEQIEEPVNPEEDFYYEQATLVVPDSNYVIALSGITPIGYGSSGQFAMKTIPPTGAIANFTFQSFGAAFNEPSKGSLWIIEEYEDGYAIKAQEIAGANNYLNILEGTAILGERQKLFINPGVDNKFRISRNINAKVYYIRFTNSYNIGGTNTSCFTASENIVSSDIILYKKEQGKDPEPVPPCETPLYTIVATSDLHTDYGLQNSFPYIRQGMIETAKQIKAEENANVLLLGGDLTSHNATSYTWTKERYDRAIAKIYETSRSATVSGRTLYATGNHDFAAGSANFNSGDYTAVMQTNIGSFQHKFDQEGSLHPHVLGYHYIIDGVNFVIINTAYINGDNHSNYVYEQSLIDWLDSMLEGIGAEKTVFVMGHYPLRDSRNISSPNKGVSTTNNCNDNLKNVLLKYKNVIYLYGHDHGGYIPKHDTYERMTLYSNSGKVSSFRNIAPTGFISAFMGSMAYYNGVLSASQPDVVQALVIYLCADRITFEMKNYGISDGGSKKLASYTILRDNLTLANDNIKDKILKKIYPNPATDHVNIELPNGNASIIITNGVGQKIFQKQSVSNIERVDLSYLKSGIYIVTIEDVSGTETSKLIIE